MESAPGYFLEVSLGTRLLAAVYITIGNRLGGEGERDNLSGQVISPGLVEQMRTKWRAGRVTLTSETIFLEINTLAPLTLT